MLDEAQGLSAVLLAYGPYINPLKLGGIFVVFTLWALIAQWVDKDTVVVNTFRLLWNLVLVGAGVVGTAVALLVPMYAIGFPAMIVVIFGASLVYVIHRNGLVEAEDSVLTPTHFRRLREEGLSGKKKVKEVRERVRISGVDGHVEIPPEEPERTHYSLAQDLFFDSLWRRAALVEVAPAGQQEAKVQYEVDGVWLDGEAMDRGEADELIQYVKEIAGLDLEERRKPQKGMIKLTIGETKHETVIRTDGTTAGEKLTVQIRYDEVNFKVPDLGFNPPQLERVEATKEETRGLILLSGPSDSGLTTSIYSFVRNHDRFLQNIQTVEYEKELEIDNVTQHVFQPDDKHTFAERLLRVVRSDPDIIVLPEIRERQAAAIASKAAAEKQKVYVTVQAVDVADALRKWITAVGDKTLVAKGLLAVCNQRLVRKLCSQCKQAYKPDPQLMRKLNLPADKVLYRKPEPEYDKHGNPIICQACQGTGYVGRVGVFDWLPVDDNLRQVIRKGSSFKEIENYVAKRGGGGLQAQALQKVLDGVTSIQEVARVMRGEGGEKKAAKPKAAAPKGAAPKAAAKKAQPKTGQQSKAAGGGRS